MLDMVVTKTQNGIEHGMEWNIEWNGNWNKFWNMERTENANWNGMGQNEYETWHRNRTETVD